MARFACDLDRLPKLCDAFGVRQGLAEIAPGRDLRLAVARAYGGVHRLLRQGADLLEREGRARGTITGEQSDVGADVGLPAEVPGPFEDLAALLRIAQQGPHERALRRLVGPGREGVDDARDAAAMDRYGRIQIVGGRHGRRG